MNTKPALGLIGGWGFDARVFADLVAAMKHDYRVNVAALPGYGSSPLTTPPADIDNLAGSLMPFVRRDITLIGWSLGGLAAIRMATRQPHRVRRLVLLASTPCFISKQGWPGGISLAMIRDMAERLPKARERVLREFAWLVARGDAAPRQTAHTLLPLAIACPAPIDILLGGLKILVEADLRDEFACLACPVTMVLGARDTLIPAGIAKAVKLLHPGVRVYQIAAAGHAPFISHSRLAARLLEEGLPAQQHEPV